MTAGAIGSFVGTPSDMIMVRMQTDPTLPPSQRRNYKNVFDALQRIPREEGVTRLWKGATPTIMRASFSSAGMFTTY